MELQPITTERLILRPFTLEICKELLANEFKTIERLGLQCGKNWPDQDMLETLPKIAKNLSYFKYPSGYESWMIIKAETHEIIGDIGFKGYKFIDDSCDLGYGIIESERLKGYAVEAAIGLIQWVFGNESLKRITAACAHENEGSARLLSKLEFKEFDRCEEFIYWILEREAYEHTFYYTDKTFY